MKYPIIASRGIVVFPGHSTKMEVGRKPSLNAIDFSIIQNESKLIVVSQKDITKDSITSHDDIFHVGTLVSVKVEKEYSSGQKTISVQGLERVKIKNLEITNDLLESDVTVLKSISSGSKEEQNFVKTISKQLELIIGSIPQVPKNVLSMLAKGVSANELTDVIAHYIPFTLEKKQSLLETLNVDDRLNLINKFMMETMQIQDIDKDLDSAVRGTLDNQQREFLLREKMKALKEELGDISSKESEIEQWRKELKDKKYPQNVREKALEEIKKYESMPTISAEANVSKGYIDWIMKLPWKTYSKDNENLDLAKKVLNKHHYGLKIVKERIVEHLAVRINTKSNNSPILALVGPPGVGKTSLAKSVGEAIGREVIKVSLGGIRDEAEIRGHRRTYVGAMPGKIIQAINRAKTSNPIILLDEIDKMSSDYKGDPTSAMLEVLDPEQNKKFQDHFLELEYDLSKVMFFATANYYDQIPSPLLDRMEIIGLDQYTSEEKLAIAKNYIIPNVIKDHGLTKNQFKISDSVIAYIIEKYTQEAGVRGLQRVMSKLARKIVLKKLENEFKGAFIITLEKAKKMLGNKFIVKEKLKGKGEVGLTNGMYYSAVGGGIMPIEVTTYPAKNAGTVLTGSVKDVMQESLKISVAYLRSNAKAFGINFDFEKNIIQVHVPEGATPKDGPSAGIAFTTALLSALKGKAVPRDVALTGEITLRGKILQIGGLKEKTIGAIEAGVKKIFIPKNNEKDIPDLAKKVIDTATIISVESYDEVYKKLF